MRYAVAAILLAFGLACLLWPARVLRAVQGNASDVLAPVYLRVSTMILRVLGFALLVAVPALFLLGYAR